MPLVDYFFPEIAMDYTTGLPVPDAEADVFALADTGFTTPLPITDMNGIPLAKLKASPTGIYPAFQCPGYTQVVAKDGGLTTPITSRYGFVLEVIPDPSTAPDDQVIATVGGAYTLAPMPGDDVSGGVNDQTGTTYTVVLSDVGKLVTLSNAAAVTVTLPQDSDVAIAVGERVDFAGIGVGLVTFVAGTGATVNGTPSLVTRARYSAATAVKIAADTWLLVGDLA